MQDDSELFELIGLAYDAALNPELWEELVRRTCLALDAPTGHLQLFEPSAPARALLTIPWARDPSRLEPKLLQSYYSYYVTVDVHLRASRESDRVYTSGDLVDRAVLERSEFLTDFMSPLDIFHFCGFASDVGKGLQATFSVHRPRRGDDFTDANKAFLQALAPHLVRASEISHRLTRVSAEREATASVLDALSAGVALLDGKGRVVFLNRAAETIFAAADGLCLDARGHPYAVERSASERLTKIISACLNADHSVAGAVADVAMVPRPGKAQGYGVTVIPVIRNSPSVGDGTRPVHAALFISQGGNVGETAPEFLRRLYGLTAAESRLAALLAEGISLDAAADILGLTRGSARVTLKRVFSKTETHRQSELVQLMLSNPVRAFTSGGKLGGGSARHQSTDRGLLPYGSGRR